MCRSIKTLRRSDDPATLDEIDAAALQFVRKISGYRVPSRTNEAAFGEAVAEVAAASRRLLELVGTVDPDPSHAHPYVPRHLRDAMANGSGS
jgi:hypothetical protein